MNFQVNKKHEFLNRKKQIDFSVRNSRYDKSHIKQDTIKL
jgi:hypothetical protein